MLRKISATRRISLFLRHMSASAASLQQSDEVILEKINNVGFITLNRVKVLNTLNRSMIAKIYPQLKTWAVDPSVSMVVIRGAGDKAFCAGGDIKAVTESYKEDKEFPKSFFSEEYNLNYAIGTFPKPYIAILNGITMGGGVGLSVHGKYRIATDKTLFAMPETAIGLFPDVGGGHFLPRLPGKLGVFLGLTGARLKGVHVYKSGIATHYLSTSQIRDFENKIIEEPTSSNIEQILESFHSKNKELGEEFIFAQDRERIDRLFAADTIEQILQNLKNDDSEWSQKQINILQKMSPLSLKITLRQLIEGANLDLNQDLHMEYRIVQRCLADPDFHEGVRALLIDKDNKPVWNPASIEQVTQEKVDSYFAPLNPNPELTLSEY